MNAADETITFDGFGADALDFLSGLAADNSVDFLDRHRQIYDHQLAGPMKALVVAVGGELQEVRPGVSFEPKVGRSLFRFHRDLRFSSDKSPYRTHVDAVFWEGSSPRSSPSFLLRVAADVVVVGVGVAGVKGARLARYRGAVVDDEVGTLLADELARAGESVPGAALGEPSRVRVPRGFPSDHPRADLLRYDGFHFAVRTDPPDELFGADLVGWCLDRYRGLVGVHEWLVDHVGDDGSDVPTRIGHASHPAQPDDVVGSSAQRSEFTST